MENLLLRFRAAALAVFAFITWSGAESAYAADDAPARPPRNAFNKLERYQELGVIARDKGEVRVIIGLETAQEFARDPDFVPDQVKEQAVSARQQRVLARVAGHNVRDIKRFRWHQFFAASVDQTA